MMTPGTQLATLGEGAAPLLVVDDDAVNRDMLSRRLARAGFSVETAASGREALAFIETRPAALVLLDVQMPEMSGLEVLQAIRRTRSSSVLPVLMVTAKDQSGDVVAALELGADDYITKPIDFPVALARIRTQLARKQAEDGLRESEERYALTAQGANDGLWDWHLTTDVIYFSPRWKSIVGCAEDEIGSQPREWLDRVHPDDQARVQEQLEAHLSGRTPHFESEHRLRHKSGAFRWVLVRGLAFRNAAGVPVRLAGSQADFTAAKVFDPLTNLPNGLLLNDRIERALQPGRSKVVRQCAVLFLDLDDFKVVNHSLGERAGDELLRAVADRLTWSLRATDAVTTAAGETSFTPGASLDHTLARLSGDEFIVLLSDVCSAMDASRVAERIQRSLTRAFAISDQEVFTSASIGIALSDASLSCPETLIRSARTAMVRAKSLGNGRSEIYDGAMREEVLRQLQLDTGLRHALAQGEFEPYFQPILDLGTGRVAGFEALLRWRHPTRGVVSPAGFVSALEANGMIVPVGHYIVDLVCQHLRQWQTASPWAERLTVNINFAARQFLEPGLVGRLLETVERHGLSPSRIVIEIIERTAIEETESTLPVLDQLRRAGFSVVLDDFGTGHSSIAQLHQLPISGLKLDTSIVAAGQKIPALLKAVMALADSLNLTVTAEGIEDEAAYTLVRRLGCTRAQGYLFERPVDAARAAEIIARDQPWVPARTAPALVSQ